MLTIQAISMVALLAILPTGFLCLPMSLSDGDGELCGDPCGDNCHNCEYGVTFSKYCQVFECRKGPDDHCNERDSCGDGMYCLCKRCFGCSTVTLKCSQLKPPCPRQARHSNLDKSRFTVF